MQTFTQAQLIASIIVALMVGFSLGRLYQMAVSGWRNWKDTKATVPGLRRTAFKRVGEVLRFGGVALLIVTALVAAAFARGMAG